MAGVGQVDAGVLRCKAAGENNAEGSWVRLRTRSGRWLTVSRCCIVDVATSAAIKVNIVPCLTCQTSERSHGLPASRMYVSSGHSTVFSSPSGKRKVT